MRVPASTCRVQLTPHAGFEHARGLLDHLVEMGVDALYLSPILAARAGSEHGYDVVDPTRISEQLGGEAAFAQLARDAHAHGLSIILDIVPNHQALDPHNPAWMDVLAHGPASQYVNWFDIAWDRASGGSPIEAGIAVPVLGGTLKQVLDEGELSLARDGATIQFRYYEWAFPLDVRGHGSIFEAAASVCDANRGVERLRSLAEHARSAPSWQEGDEQPATRRREIARSVIDALSELVADQSAANAIDQVIAAVNQHPTAEAPVSADAGAGADELTIESLLAGQPYRPELWRTAMRDLSYRRFFDITHLIGVRVEDPDVFKQTHARTLELMKDGLVDGLRIDHIDGLAEPGPYLEQLQQAAWAYGAGADGCYVLVEKILEGAESLPDDWPVAGTTGYDWLNAAGSVFVDRAGGEKMADHQRNVLGGPADFHQLVVGEKARLAVELFGGEVEYLHEGLTRVLDSHPGPTMRTDDLKDALIAVSAAVPVYRTYITRDDVRANRRHERDVRILEQAIDEARMSRHSLDTPALAGLADVLLGRWPTVEQGDDRLNAAADWIIAWQQFTGPLTAKGLEDTALYRDVRLISLNEVGVDAERLERPGDVQFLHEHNARAQAKWPGTMTATSTHDTKRSEDARMRLHVLSELADQWLSATNRWRELNEPHRQRVDDGPAPRPPMEHLLYQSMLAVWPLDGTRDPGLEFADRLVAYAIKAAREAKRRTSWIDADTEYERALEQFVRTVLDPSAAPRFIEEIDDWAGQLAWYGALNSLVHVVLKIASPGVPDLYNGCETWNFSLVDPDNRRPIDWDRIAATRASLPDAGNADVSENVGRLLSRWRDGAIKMHITRAALRARRERRDLFIGGEYQPLRVTGFRADHACAFARHAKDQHAVTVAGRLMTSFAKPEIPPTGHAVWTDTAASGIDVPATRWRDVLTGRSIEIREGVLSLAEAFATLPVALLVAES